MNGSNWIFKGARVIDPASGTDEVKDVFVKDGVFSEPFSETEENTTVVELDDLVIAPGFIDLHTHLRQPGKTEAETIRTGTMAAAAGGFTTIVAMPNTSPCADSASTIKYVQEYAAKEGVVRVLPCGAMSKNLEGQEMAPIGSLKAAGAVAISDDGKCIQNNALMRHVVEYASSFGLPVLDHCEDAEFAAKGVMNEGYWSVLLGMKGMSHAAEEIIVARDIMLAEMSSWKIHIQHVSCAGAVELIRAAREKGIQVTAEATPHHITLTDVEIKKFDTNFKMNPPLRSEADRQAVIEGLCDGTIQAIATDHAPHTRTAKQVEFDYAPFGIIGLETAFPLAMTELYHKDRMSLSMLVEKFTLGPAGVLGIEAGTLAIGKPADMTIFDPDEEYVIDANNFYSKSRNTPFDGFKVKGAVKATFVGGKCVYNMLPDVGIND